MNAFEEFKNWCEKYIPKEKFTIFTPVGDPTLTAIHITDDALRSQFYFKAATGEYYGGEEMY